MSSDRPITSMRDLTAPEPDKGSGAIDSLASLMDWYKSNTGKKPTTNWAGKDALTQSELEDVLRQAGWDETYIPRMAAIGMAEAAHTKDGRAKINSYNPGVGPNGPTVEQSVGIWQINMHPTLTDRKKYDRQRLATDPVYNAKVALELFRERQAKGKDGYTHWSAYTDGRYKTYYSQKASAPNPVVDQNYIRSLKDLVSLATKSTTPENPTGAMPSKVGELPGENPMLDPSSLAVPPTATPGVQPVGKKPKEAKPSLPPVDSTKPEGYAEWLAYEKKTDTPETLTAYKNLVATAGPGSVSVDASVNAPKVVDDPDAWRRAVVSVEGPAALVRSTRELTDAEFGKSIANTVTVDLSQAPAGADLKTWGAEAALQAAFAEQGLYGQYSKGAAQRYIAATGGLQLDDLQPNERVRVQISNKDLSRAMGAEGIATVLKSRYEQQQVDQTLDDPSKVYNTPRTPLQERQALENPEPYLGREDTPEAQRYRQAQQNIRQGGWLPTLNELGIPTSAMDGPDGGSDPYVSNVDRVGAEYDRLQRGELSQEEKDAVSDITQAQKSELGAFILNPMLGIAAYGARKLAGAKILPFEDTLASVGAGAAAEAGRTAAVVGGIARTLGIAPDAFGDAIQKFSNKATLLEQQDEERNPGVVSILARATGSTPGFLARITLLSKLPGGAVTAFAADSYAQAKGSGATTSDSLIAGGYGAILGGMFKVAHGAQAATKAFLSPTEQVMGAVMPAGMSYSRTAATHLASRAVAIGTIAGGTFMTTKTQLGEGATPEERWQKTKDSFDSAIHMALIDMAFNIKTDLSAAVLGAGVLAGRTLRFIDRRGTDRAAARDVSISPDGTVYVLDKPAGKVDAVIDVSAQKSAEAQIVELQGKLARARSPKKKEEYANQIAELQKISSQSTPVEENALVQDKVSEVPAAIGKRQEGDADLVNQMLGNTPEPVAEVKDAPVEVPKPSKKKVREVKIAPAEEAPVAESATAPAAEVAAVPQQTGTANVTVRPDAQPPHHRGKTGVFLGDHPNNPNAIQVDLGEGPIWINRKFVDMAEGTQPAQVVPPAVPVEAPVVQETPRIEAVRAELAALKNKRIALEEEARAAMASGDKQAIKNVKTKLTKLAKKIKPLSDELSKLSKVKPAEPPKEEPKAEPVAEPVQESAPETVAEPVQESTAPTMAKVKINNDRTVELEQLDNDAWTTPVGENGRSAIVFKVGKEYKVALYEGDTKVREFPGIKTKKAAFDMADRRDMIWEMFDKPKDKPMEAPKVEKLTAETAIKTLDEMQLNAPDISKAQVKAYAKELVDAGLLDKREFENLQRMVKDKDMGSEDMISDLQTSLNIKPDAPVVPVPEPIAEPVAEPVPAERKIKVIKAEKPVQEEVLPPEPVEPFVESTKELEVKSQKPTGVDKDGRPKAVITARVPGQPVIYRVTVEGVDRYVAKSENGWYEMTKDGSVWIPKGNEPLAAQQKGAIDALTTKSVENVQVPETITGTLQTGRNVELRIEITEKTLEDTGERQFKGKMMQKFLDTGIENVVGPAVFTNTKSEAIDLINSRIGEYVGEHGKPETFEPVGKVKEPVKVEPIEEDSEVKLTIDNVERTGTVIAVETTKTGATKYSIELEDGTITAALAKFVRLADTGEISAVMDKAFGMTLEKAREINSRKQFNAGFDPVQFQALLRIGADHVVNGARTFAEFSGRLIEEFGESVRPYLKSVYQSIRDMPDFDPTGMDMELPASEGFKTGMTKTRGAIENMEKKGILARDEVTGTYRYYEERSLNAEVSAQQGRIEAMGIQRAFEEASQFPEELTPEQVIFVGEVIRALDKLEVETFRNGAAPLAEEYARMSNRVKEVRGSLLTEPATVLRAGGMMYTDPFAEGVREVEAARGRNHMSKNLTSAEKAALKEASEAYATAAKALEAATKALDKNNNETTRNNRDIALDENMKAYTTYADLKRHLSSPPPGYAHRIAKLMRMAMVATINTAANNLVNSSVTRGMFRLRDLIDLSLRKTGVGLADERGEFPQKGEVVMHADKPVSVLSFSEANRKVTISQNGKPVEVPLDLITRQPAGMPAEASFYDIIGMPREGGVGAYVRELAGADKLVQAALREYPELNNELYGDYLTDVDTTNIRSHNEGLGHKVLDKLTSAYTWLNTPNKIQEYLSRDLQVMQSLQVRLGAKGLDLVEMDRNKDYRKITKEDWAYAIAEARRISFSMRPEQGTVASGVINWMHGGPTREMLSVFTVPFANFSYNVAKMTSDFVPILAQAKAMKKVNARNPHDALAVFKPNKYSATEMANSIVGFGLMAAAYGLVKHYGTSDEFYLIEVPYTKGMAADSVSPIYFDTRTQPQFLPFLWLAHKMQRAETGKPLFTYNDPAAIASEVTEAFMSLSYRSTLERNAFLQMVYHTAASVAVDGNKHPEKAIFSFYQLLGNTAGIFLSPGRPLKNMLDSVTDAPDKDLNDHPGLQAFVRNLPKALFGSLPDMENKATGNTKFRRFDWLKPFGLTLVDGAETQKNLTAGEALAAQMARGNLVMERPMLAEDKFLVDLKRDYEKESDRARLTGNRESLENMKQRLAMYVANGQLTQEDADRVKKNIETSDLEENFSRVSAVPKRGESVSDVERLWPKLSAEEQEKLRPALMEKLATALGEGRIPTDARNNLTKLGLSKESIDQLVVIGDTMRAEKAEESYLIEQVKQGNLDVLEGTTPEVRKKLIAEAQVAPDIKDFLGKSIPERMFLFRNENMNRQAQLLPYLKKAEAGLARKTDDVSVAQRADVQAALDEYKTAFDQRTPIEKIQLLKIEQDEQAKLPATQQKTGTPRLPKLGVPKLPSFKPLADLTYGKDGITSDNYDAQIAAANSGPVPASWDNPNAWAGARQSTNVVDVRPGTEAYRIHQALDGDVDYNEFARVVDTVDTTKLTPADKDYLLERFDERVKEFIPEEIGTALYRKWTELRTKLTTKTKEPWM